MALSPVSNAYAKAAFALRRTVAGAAAFGLVLASTGANGQVVKTAGPGQPTGSFEQHCDDIKDVFALARFNGDYKRRADAWVANKCRGEVPIPSLNEPHNVKRFNTSAGILQNGGGIALTP
jgi:hypothetical protein